MIARVGEARQVFVHDHLVIRAHSSSVGQVAQCAGDDVPVHELLLRVNWVGGLHAPLVYLVLFFFLGSSDNED